jgi:hypothetical protein
MYHIEIIVCFAEIVMLQRQDVLYGEEENIVK